MNESDASDPDTSTPCTDIEMTDFKMQCVNLRLLSSGTPGCNPETSNALLSNVQCTVSKYFTEHRPELDVSANHCNWACDLDAISHEQRRRILSSLPGCKVPL